MRISQFLVCFFLPFSFGSAPVQTDWWARLHTLETQAETCDIHHASSVSKDLSKLYQEILSQKDIFYVATHPYAEDIQVEPKNLYGFMLPLFTEFFVDEIATGKY